MADNDRLRRALLRLSGAALEAVNSPGEDRGADEDEEDGVEAVDRPSEAVSQAVCVPKKLSNSVLLKASKTAVEVNPANSVFFGPMAAAPGGAPLDPLQIAVLTGKYWGPAPRTLSVRFLDTNSRALKNKILQHLNSWSESCGIQFRESSSVGEVRITRGRTGHWSYVGTDILQIPASRATMNLQEFTTRTPDSEYRRVVRHEAGHTLGFPHEHMRRQLVARIDRNKAYEYFLRTQGWDRAMVDAQVLTSLDDRSIFATPSDQTSIMCYQLPGDITRDGRPILGGNDINATDRAFAARIYPKSAAFAVADDDEVGDDE